jgi:Adenylate and Guanylate cyclase catalytic domain
VIRGERARFQLFGDSVNTTARIESTGKPDQIHLSEQAFKELKRQGKGHWCVPRAEKVVAKGKGELETYWLLLDSGRVCDNNALTMDGPSAAPVPVGPASSNRNNSVSFNYHHHHADNNNEPPALRLSANSSTNLIDWNTEILVQLLSNVVACRPRLKFDQCRHSGPPMTEAALTQLGRALGASPNIVGEMADMIVMPKWTGGKSDGNVDAGAARLDAAAVGHVRAFVERIAALYNNVPCKFRCHFSLWMHRLKLTTSTTTTAPLSYSFCCSPQF